MTELCALAAKWRTDKGGYHGYTPFYYELLEGRRQSVRKVLEIGIGTPDMAGHMPGYKPGASLFMWEEYFPNAQIFGLDLDSSLYVNQGRIKSFYCNQADANSLNEVRGKVGGDFDLIVDDGSHNPQDQVLSAKILVSLLAPTGLYVIEDVMRPDLVVHEVPVFEEGVPYKFEMKEFNCSGPGSIPDDRMIVIQRA